MAKKFIHKGKVYRVETIEDRIMETINTHEPDNPDFCCMDIFIRKDKKHVGCYATSFQRKIGKCINCGRIRRKKRGEK